MYRYERKYRVTDCQVEQVVSQLYSNRAGFVTAYPDRWVNSIYYDDDVFSAYNDNLSGISNRSKYRIRWYGELDKVMSPITEKKIKDNMLGTKVFSQVYVGFDYDNLLPIDVEDRVLFPRVLVRYSRKYYHSYDRKIRATIDSSLTYDTVMSQSLSKGYNYDSAIIVEIKYDQDQAEFADQIMQDIPFRITKNSKYVSAMQYYLY